MASRRADSEPLLHDHLHLLPYLQVQQRGRPRRFDEIIRPTAMRLTSSSPPPSIRVPGAAFNVSDHIRSAMSADPELGSIGRPLLASFLEEDQTIERARLRWDPYVGNALLALHGGGGGHAPWLLHPVGDNMDELVVRSLGHSASASPSIASCALPRGQRVLQLAGAVDGEPNAIVSRGDGEQERAHAALAPRLIAARTHSSVHHVLLGMDGGAGTSAEPHDETVCRVVSSIPLERRPLHVAINPAIAAETACLLDDGTLQLLRVERTVKMDVSQPYRYTTNETAPLHGITLTEGRERRVTSALPGSGSARAGAALDKPWGCIEYAGHPRTLYIASGSGLYLNDLREPTAAPTLLFDAQWLPLPELRAGAMAVPPSTRHTSVSGASPLVALSSSEQLVLFDIRSARRPLLQWRMPLPMPLRDALPGVPGVPLPHYFVGFAGGGADFVQAIDRVTARPLIFDCRGAGGPVQTAYHMPTEATLPLGVDPDLMLCRHAHQMEATSPGSALPLVGATILPLSHRERNSFTGVAREWAVATVNPRGGLQLLLADHELGTDQSHVAGRPGVDTEGRAEVASSALDEFCILRGSKVAGVVEDLRQAAELPISEAASRATVPIPPPPLARDTESLSSTEDGIASILTSQWEEWMAMEQSSASSNVPSRASAAMALSGVGSSMASAPCAGSAAAGGNTAGACQSRIATASAGSKRNRSSASHTGTVTTPAALPAAAATSGGGDESQASQPSDPFRLGASGSSRRRSASGAPLGKQPRRSSGF